MSHFVMVIDTLSGGGAEKVLLRLAEAVIKKNHYVTVVVINPIVQHDTPEGVDIVFLRQSKERGWKLIYYWNTARQLQRLLDKINEKKTVQAVVSNLPETDRITRFLRGYKVFYCVHSALYRSLVGHKTGWKKWLRVCRLRRVYGAKDMIFVSEGARQDLLQNGNVFPATSKVIYNPFPIEDIQRLAEEEIPELMDYFICVGRFNEVKRHDKLLKIYADSALENPLVLMGDGDEKSTRKIEYLIQKYRLQNRVILTGFRKNPFPYIRHARALLLTSDYEGLGNVLVEALICGTPVVAYDCPSGPREILTDKLTEFLIPLDDEQAFISKVQELAMSPRRISGEIANLRRFDADSIAQEYMDWLDKP